MKVTIIGTGYMANGIGMRIVAGNHSLTIVGRNEGKARSLAKKLGKDVKWGNLSDKLSGDIIIFTLPYTGIPDVIKAYNTQLSDKILVDISNPVDLKTFELTTPAGSSGAEEIAKLLPKGAKLIKAFNTTFAGILADRTVAGKWVDVFVAGDDQKAKKIVMRLVSDGALRAIDVGPLKHARQLEGMQLIHMSLQKTLGTNGMSTIRIASPIDRTKKIETESYDKAVDNDTFTQNMLQMKKRTNSSPQSPGERGSNSVSGLTPSPDSDDDVLQNAHQMGIAPDADLEHPKELNIAKDVADAERDLKYK